MVVLVDPLATVGVDHKDDDDDDNRSNSAARVSQSVSQCRSVGWFGGCIMSEFGFELHKNKV